MARVLLVSLLLLAVPFAAYAAYFRFVRGETENVWREAPIVLLAVVGVAIAVIGLIGMMSLTGY